MLNTVEISNKDRRAASSTISMDGAELQEVAGISPSLRGLSQQHLDTLLRAARIQRFPAEQIIGSEGDKAESLFLVLEGEVSVFLGVELREVTALLGRGGVFGGNMLVGEMNSFSYATERDTVVASWTDDALRRADGAAPGLLRELSIRLSKDERWADLSDILQHAPLLRNTSAVLRHRLLNEMTLMQFPAGSFIYEEGQPATCCYLVVNGEVEVSRPGAAGQLSPTTLLGRGALFGEADLLGSGKRSETAEAKVEETELLAIDRIDVLALQRACSSFRRAIAAHIRSEEPLAKPQDRFLSRLSPIARFQDTIRAMYLMMRDAGTRQATAAHITFAPASVGQFNLLDFASAKKMVAATELEVPRFIELTKAKYTAFCRNRDY